MHIFRSLTIIVVVGLSAVPGYGAVRASAQHFTPLDAPFAGTGSG